MFSVTGTLASPPPTPLLKRKNVRKYSLIKDTIILPKDCMLSTKNYEETRENFVNFDELKEIL